MKNTPELIIDAAVDLMSLRGFNGVSMREIAKTAGVNLGSVTYHFKSKEKLLEAMYERYSQPMNLRRIEMLAEAERISDLRERIIAIVRAYIIPAFSSKSDLSEGGAKFTRVRGILSMGGNDKANAIISQHFDEISEALVSAIQKCFPYADRNSIIWRCHFLLGSLYYTLAVGDRIDRLTKGVESGTDQEKAIEELSHTFAAAFHDLEKQ